MATFEVTVVSSFKHKIAVEAEDVASAQAKVENFDLDFYQRHMGEIVTKVKKVKGTKSEAIERFRKKGYF